MPEYDKDAKIVQHKPSNALTQLSARPHPRPFSVAYFGLATEPWLPPAETALGLLIGAALPAG